MNGSAGGLLAEARRLAASSDDEAATRAYVAVLRDEPGSVAALIELAALAEAGGFARAGRTA